MAEIQQVTKTDNRFRESWVRAPHSTRSKTAALWLLFLFRKFNSCGERVVVSAKFAVSKSMATKLSIQ